jgi:hypothetical protein
VIAIEERRDGRGKKSVTRGRDGERGFERFEVVSADSSLAFFATSTLFPVYGKATDVVGHVEGVWSHNGALAANPLPRMHLELKVEGLRTGNDLQDREMWKLIDSKRFPKIVAELRELSAGTLPGRYVASGAITLSGLARRYEGELQVSRAGEYVRVSGDINVDVRDFGLKSMSLLVLSVEPLVRVRLRMVALREG